MRMGIGGLAFAAGCVALSLTGVAQASTYATGSRAGIRTAADAGSCPSGSVCMFTYAGFPSDTIEHRWAWYGCDNLFNEWGDRIVINNQVGGAAVTLYKGGNCGGQVYTTIAQDGLWQGDIGPVNSLSLQP
jgi:hypothetical protein